MTWMGDTIPPIAPTSILYKEGTLQWQASPSRVGGLLYNIYGSNLYPVDVTKAENLLVTRVHDTHWTLNARAQKLRYYAITAIDRFGNESPALQQKQPTIEPPRQIDVTRLINRNLKGSKPTMTTGKKKKKKK
jgi:hypothetical protein